MNIAMFRLFSAGVALLLVPTAFSETKLGPWTCDIIINQRALALQYKARDLPSFDVDNDEVLFTKTESDYDELDKVDLGGKEITVACRHAERPASEYLAKISVENATASRYTRENQRATLIFGRQTAFFDGLPREERPAAFKLSFVPPRSVLRAADYVVFAIFLCVSLCTGLFYAYFASVGEFVTVVKNFIWKTEEDGNVKKDIANVENADLNKEYLLGGGNMTTTPIAMSLLASFMSAITLQGTPSEIYTFGTQYMMICVGYCLSLPFVAYLILPTLYRMKLLSSYEYLEVRFHVYVRRFAAILFILQMTFYMGMVVYTPSLAMAAVTDANLWACIIPTGLICIIYTTVGGIRGVMWTDVLQVVLMYIGLLVVLIYGSTNVEGGFGEAWRYLESTGRAQFFDPDPNPFIKYTLWTTIIGGCMTWNTVYGCNQAQVQRLVTAKSLKIAQRSLLLNIPGLITIMGMPGLCGVLILYTYKNCDPQSAGLITARDQLLPFYVVRLFRDIPGLSGLLMAMLFSGALSTVSSGINSLAAVVSKDFLEDWLMRDSPLLKNPVTQVRVSKLISLLFGLSIYASILVVSNWGGMLSAALALFGIVGGPTFAMFVCGLFIPYINWQGALSGGVVSFAVGLIHMISGQTYDKGATDYRTSFAVNTAECASYLPRNMTDKPTIHYDISKFASPFGVWLALSYLYQSVQALIICLAVAFVVSYVVKKRGLESESRMTVEKLAAYHPIVKRFAIKKVPSEPEGSEMDQPVSVVNNGYEMSSFDLATGHKS